MCGLRLPHSSLFLEVLDLYTVHPVQRCPNVVSRMLTFEAFSMSHHILLKVVLFCYFYRLKRYDDWYSFNSHHFPLSLDLSSTNSGWKSKFCWVDIHSFFFFPSFLVTCLPFMIRYHCPMRYLLIYLYFIILCTEVFFAKGCSCVMSYEPYLESAG